MDCQPSEPFVLQVLGDSMEPEFPNGCVVVVEPGQAVEDHCFVIARDAGGFLFRQLFIEHGRWCLRALNPTYPEVAISGPEVLRGRVIQRAGRRRRDRKFYL